MDKKDVLFVIQYKDTKEFIEQINSISTDYYLYETKDERLGVVQCNKSLPFYNEPMFIKKGDYLIPMYKIGTSIIFAVMSEKIYNTKYSNR